MARDAGIEPVAVRGGVVVDVGQRLQRRRVRGAEQGGEDAEHDGGICLLQEGSAGEGGEKKKHVWDKRWG